jgi:hypothetical protein
MSGLAAKSTRKVQGRSTSIGIVGWWRPSNGAGGIAEAEKATRPSVDYQTQLYVDLQVNGASAERISTEASGGSNPLVEPVWAPATAST